jgi:hypothetical protein
VECAYCQNTRKVRRKDLLAAESISYVLCKECFRAMAAAYRKTGIWGPP